MDPVTAFVNLVTEAIKARAQWWASLTPETQTKLAEKYADAEIRWLEFFEKLRPAK